MPDHSELHQAKAAFWSAPCPRHRVGATREPFPPPIISLCSPETNAIIDRSFGDVLSHGSIQIKSSYGSQESCSGDGRSKNLAGEFLICPRKSFQALTK